jgi:hypothetical protein
MPMIPGHIGVAAEKVTWISPCGLLEWGNIALFTPRKLIGGRFFPMAKVTLNAGTADEPAIEIDLKNRRLAALLAWLLPGLGHLYQGRNGKGVLFFVCIVGTFVYGLYIGEGRVVYAATSDVLSRKFLDRWQYICQVGVGLPALPAYVQAWRADRHQPPLFGWDNFMRPPRTNGPF